MDYDHLNDPSHPDYALHKAVEKALLGYKDSSKHSMIRDSFGYAVTAVAVVRAAEPVSPPQKRPRRARAPKDAGSR